MTEELFREDAQLRQCEARVTAVDAESGVRLDRTVFYPQGGGQAGDAGHLLLADGSKVVIADTRKGPNAGEVLHLLLKRFGRTKIAKAAKSKLRSAGLD